MYKRQAYDATAQVVAGLGQRAGKAFSSCVETVSYTHLGWAEFVSAMQVGYGTAGGSGDNLHHAGGRCV